MMKSFVLVSLLGFTLAAQSPPTILRLLPAGAQIIETADISRTVGKPRMMVLWMLRPVRRVRPAAAEYCGDSVYGDYWEGPARLSLVNPAAARLLGTVSIAEAEWFEKDTLFLPFRVYNPYYRVPALDSKNQGRPNLLYLRDLTGEGKPLQFGLFTYEACGIVSSTILGYSFKTDQVVQYQFVVTGDRKGTHPRFWVSQVLSRPALRPGHWKFSWRPGHGSNGSIDEEVDFDATLQVFRQQRVFQEADEVP